ncbi:MAG: heavy-metal-associated domain-containing protein [Hyphococcus sp.]
MIRTTLFTAALLLASPVMAQETDDHDRHDHEAHEHAATAHNANDHEAHKPEAHDHEAHEHEARADETDESEASASAAPLARTADIDAALAAGGEAVVVDVLGVVCDFCAKAMNKTFGKRDEVAAVYVDLDTKTLNLVMRPAMTLSDDRIRELVTKAGYKTAAIRRGETALNGGGDAADRS